ncbi:SDR family oxidoreductase [Actinosynnema pretiosum subsp. pretiosum]|uniref:Short-chain dehydrogenase/reductase SDR n=2 Tax=Actinosynnema TaxID=40566 RepID=C6W8W8_ACTMD|nr:SDR family oxidoreductase [Actinosynnema mirum]ACU37217.1 short-chain dehydrogenase/reductase SDR [Actinosynnema mirum DSM 43827]AXX30682.1 Short-chain dehydrogenase/reductase SDR [Actinosynnema pretiosum subsp. pretiosum]QUF05199.1 SDR family oxidoreductase [Actinosynnema pretiosum subsp. pretiosum]
MTEHRDAGDRPAEVVLITGASSGFGRLTALALARAGHTVVAGMRATADRNAPAVAELADLARAERLALSAVDLDVRSQESADRAVAETARRHGRLDVVVHNAGHMVEGPAEAFTPEQLADLYDVNTVGAHRVNRAALPLLREQGSGLLVWVGSSSTRGGHPPFLAPYFAAKAGMDALAESCAAELIRFGVGTTIVVPGAFTSGTNHFANAGRPADPDRAAAYDHHYGELRATIGDRLSALVPQDADARDVADEITRVVGLPADQRPFRVHVDPSRDGSEVVSAVADRVRVEFYRRVGIEDLLPRNAAL